MAISQAANGGKTAMVKLVFIQTALKSLAENSRWHPR